MDDLFAAIADHLRRHNRRLDHAPIERVWPESVRAHGGAGVYCRVCGKLILSGEGLVELESLWADRLCADHYSIPF